MSLPIRGLRITRQFIPKKELVVSPGPHNLKDINADVTEFEYHATDMVWSSRWGGATNKVFHAATTFFDKSTARSCKDENLIDGSIIDGYASVIHSKQLASPPGTIKRFIFPIYYTVSTTLPVIFLNILLLVVPKYC